MKKVFFAAIATFTVFGMEARADGGCGQSHYTCEKDGKEVHAGMFCVVKEGDKEKAQQICKDMGAEFKWSGNSNRTLNRGQLNRGNQDRDEETEE
jgi:hypothetical protein